MVADILLHHLHRLLFESLRRRHLQFTQGLAETGYGIVELAATHGTVFVVELYLAFLDNEKPLQAWVFFACDNGNHGLGHSAREDESAVGFHLDGVDGSLY